MSSLSQWWNTPSHFDWLSEYVRSRGLEPQARVITGAMTAFLGLMPVVMLLSPAGPHGTVGRTIAVGIALTCGVMGVLWTIRWPTQGQSIVYVTAMNVCSFAACLAQSHPLVGLQAASCFTILAGYVAFFHAARLYVVTLAFTAVTAVTLGIELAATTHDYVLAITKVILVILSMAALPFASQMLMAYLGIDVANSDVDPLTGLSNRRGFGRRASTLIGAPNDAGSGVVLAVIMIDLDDFKKVNDTYGHATGDRALMAVAGILRRNCHPDRAVVARVGGEEFLIADKGGADVDGIAERIRLEIAESPFAVTASVGAATGPLDSPRRRTELLDALVVTADEAMYAAKRAGGNRVVCLQPGIGSASSDQG